MPLWTPGKITGSAAKYRCVGCGAEFAEGQHSKYASHVDRCSDESIDLLQAMADEIHNDPINDYDREAFAFGREREAEGRRGFKGGYPT